MEEKERSRRTNLRKDEGRPVGGQGDSVLSLRLHKGEQEDGSEPGNGDHRRSDPQECCFELGELPMKAIREEQGSRTGGEGEEEGGKALKRDGD